MTAATGTTRMLAEIREQPAALHRTIEALLPLRPAVAALAGRTRQVLFIARGSSDAAALYGRYLCEVGAGRLATPASPSVATRYHRRLDLAGVLAVALSQSGRTEEIVETLAWAADCGATTVAITNDGDSPLAAAAELALVTRAGPERAVPATKSYTTQLAALVVLALGLGADPALREGLVRVPDAVAALLDTDPEPLASALSDVDGLVVSGRGFAASTAWELSLKVRETCSIDASGLSYADLLHGPIAVAGPRTPALLVAAGDGPVLSGVLALADRLAAAGVPVHAIGGGDALRRRADTAVPGPDLPEQLAPLGLVVPGQLAVEALARRLGLDPDAPGGLAKVTQTDERPA
ncbi:MAG: Glucosamine-6-phosphate deaminase [isomerizing], alternative [uncultured Corynebacteriales bacterium]|uniref:Glucosamine-6-phosphate deaminase [isomerizing], alternative n=1 Tax=uncultured Mycobacteriales bacterium TaxID=581187 RepID=A0A6J4IUP5_9ACTN|nr:MAG: Glucosamine-6-phosphate deaminase [isomerizing], alternative [uncultured Corynebacteriales bacterium]